MPKFFKIEVKVADSREPDKTLLYNINSVYKVESFTDDFNGAMIVLHFYDRLSIRFRMKLEDFMLQLRAFESSSSDLMALPYTPQP